ncbi:MAG: hypothetical protein WA981_12885 [Glaciecola sp.]
MRKTIIILLQLILLVVFLRSSFAQHFFGNIADTVSTWYYDIIEVPERRKMMQLRDTFMRNNMSLQPHQVDYVLEVTDTVEKLDDFYRLYCARQDKNPFLYGANLQKFCTDIVNANVLTLEQ